jgi:hypothetical protein
MNDGGDRPSNRAMRTLTACSLFVALVSFGVPGCMMPQGNYGGTSPSSSSGPDPAAATGGAESGGGGGSGGGAPSGPQIDSLSLHNDCAQTVKLFLGDKPKWGSGTSTTIGSNVTQSFTLNPGDKVWIVDQNDEGVTSYAGQPGMHSMKITSGCNQFSTN